ncbi:MAG: WecB/TagA/CpsF family glycosyltransferase [Pseudomonadota bacterium]
MTQADAELLEVLLKTERDSRAWTLAHLTPEQRVQRLMFLNAHGVNCAAQDAAFRQQLLDCEYLLRDGIGVSLGLKALGLAETENLNGTDLIPKILSRHKQLSTAIWGSSEEALEKLQQRLTAEGYDNIVSLEHGFHDDAFYIERYRALRPRILVLCMGMPRQELLAGKLAESLAAATDAAGGLIVCGGGWADFHSNHKQRAPLWVQRLRLEWLHRLSREPGRLGKRYTVDIFQYFMTIARLSRVSKAR